MNDELKTDEQLRLATTRSLTTHEPLEAETTSARDAFLALGSAVEAAAANFDEAALVQRLSENCLPESPAVQAPAMHRNWWPVIASGAIAAGMLLAIAEIARERQVHTVPVAGAGQTVTTTPKTVRTPQVAAVSQLWNDPLDDEIALAAVTIQRFSPAMRGVDGSLLEMNDQIESLSRELFGETL
jgi:hypothetical protein